MKLHWALWGKLLLWNGQQCNYPYSERTALGMQYKLHCWHQLLTYFHIYRKHEIFPIMGHQFVAIKRKLACLFFVNAPNVYHFVLPLQPEYIFETLWWRLFINLIHNLLRKWIHSNCSTFISFVSKYRVGVNITLIKGSRLTKHLLIDFCK